MGNGSAHLLGVSQRAISDNKMVGVPSQPRSCPICYMSFLLNISKFLLRD